MNRTAVARELMLIAKSLAVRSSAAYDDQKLVRTIEYESTVQAINARFFPDAGYYHGVKTGIWVWFMRLDPVKYQAVKVDVAIYEKGKQGAGKIVLSAGRWGHADNQLENAGFKNLAYGIAPAVLKSEIINFIKSLEN